MIQTTDSVTLFGGKQAEGFSYEGKFVASRGLEHYITYKLSSQLGNTVKQYALNNSYPLLVIALRVEPGYIGTIDFEVFDSLDAVIYTGKLNGNPVYLPVGVPVPVNARFTMDTNVYDVNEPAIIARRISAEIIPIVGSNI